MDSVDPSVRGLTPQQGEIPRPRILDVVGVSRVTGEEAPVLSTLNGGTDHLSRSNFLRIARL
jgi:hypothetical protein